MTPSGIDSGRAGLDRTNWGNVKIEATLAYSSDLYDLWKFPRAFEKQETPASLFRPGQIFSTAIFSSVFMKNDRQSYDMDCDDPPLEPMPSLEAVASNENHKDRLKRLAQIRNLPLRRMTVYCKETSSETGQVQCLLCRGAASTKPWDKDQWATSHFRFDHWRYYYGMLPDTILDRFRSEDRNNIVPWKEPARTGTTNIFSPDEWIKLEHMARDVPIPSEENIIDCINSSSFCDPVCSEPGPVQTMIRRFVVIREGPESCLCLGIHTWVSSTRVVSPSPPHYWRPQADGSLREATRDVGVKINQTSISSASSTRRSCLLRLCPKKPG